VVLNALRLNKSKQAGENEMTHTPNSGLDQQVVSG
jgi:hypothetical protein